MSLKNQSVVGAVVFTTILNAAIAGALSGCATASREPETAPIESSNIQKATDKEGESQGPTQQEQIAKLQEKIQDLETRLSALNDKINLEQGAQADSKSSIATQVVQPPSAHAKVIPVAKTPAKKAGKDITNEYLQNESIDRFREAKILYDSKRYADSIVEFASFVKEEPEHSLAAASQYYVGMGYLKQKEYKLAEEELNRVLIAYPHSNYTPDTLLALIEVSENLQKPARVTYYKQKLLSAFPNSPQAKGISLDSRVEMPAKKTARAETIETPEIPVPPTAPKAVIKEPLSEPTATEGDPQ